MTKTIDITSRDQVRRISELASRMPYEVWLSTDTVMLDARSLLGLYALVGKKARVVAEDDVNPRSFSRLVEKMARLPGGSPAPTGAGLLCVSAIPHGTWTKEILAGQQGEMV